MTFSTKTFVNAVKLAKKASDANGGLAGSDALFLRQEGDELVMVTSGYAAHLEQRLTADESSAPLSPITVSPEHLLAAVAGISSDSLTLDAGGKGLAIGAANYKARILALASQTAPDEPPLKTPGAAVAKSADLSGGLQYAAQATRVKPGGNQQGRILIESKGQSLQLVGANRSLVLVDEVLSSGNSGGFKFYLSSRLETLLTLFLKEDPESETALAFSADGKRAKFTSGDGKRSLTLTAVNTPFPNFEHFLKPKTRANVLAETSELRFATVSLRNLLGDSGYLRLEYIAAAQIVRMSTVNGFGDAETTLAVNGSGEDFTVCLTHQYLLAALHDAGKQVNLLYTGPRAPVLITGDYKKAVIAPILEEDAALEDEEEAA